MRSVIIHQQVKDALKRLKDKYPSFSGFYIVRIAKEAETDTKTAVRHLEILEENELGKFLDPDKKVFSFY